MSNEGKPVTADAATPGLAGPTSEPRLPAGRGHHRPLHLHPGFVLLVMVGGAFGALARYGLSLVLPAPGNWPLPTLLINLAGALLLGMLLEGLSRRGPDTGRRRFLRLLLGTGFMGAFTTYSTLAVDALHLFDAGRPSAAVAYLAASLVGGVLAALAGIWCGAKVHTSTSTTASTGKGVSR